MTTFVPKLLSPVGRRLVGQSRLPDLDWTAAVVHEDVDVLVVLLGGVAVVDHLAAVNLGWTCGSGAAALNVAVVCSGLPGRVITRLAETRRVICRKTLWRSLC